MTLHKKIPSQIGIPIKKVDKTSTPKKLAELKILKLKKESEPL